MSTKFVIDMFPPELIALNREIENHPELQIRLANHKLGDLEVSLAEIALYCDVALDGVYGPNDVVPLCDILVNKLRAKRSRIILLN